MRSKRILMASILFLMFLAVLRTQLPTVVAETTAIQSELYPEPDLFDPCEFYTVREAEGEGRDYWVDCPSVFFDTDMGVFWLAHRWRKPLPERGHTIVIANSTDGIHFTDVWSARKEEFPVPNWSLTRPSILRDPKTGMFKLYISKGEPWQVFKLDDVRDPANFNTSSVRLVLGKGATGEWDEYDVGQAEVRWIEDRYVMLYMGKGPVDDVVTQRLGIAMSFDGETWEKNPNNPILDGGGEGSWDEGIRFGAIWRYSDQWVVPYTGIHIPGYRERDLWTGLAEWRPSPTWPYPKLTKLTVDKPFLKGIDEYWKTLKHLDCVPVQFANGTRRAYFYYSTGTEDGSVDIRVSISPWIDWWPMFRHDLWHTGYSTSTAPNTNNTLWNYTTGGWVHSSPAVSGGVVYVGSDDGKVYALNATTGGLIWNFSTSREVRSSPAVSGGVVYVGSYNGRVYALNGTTGDLVWRSYDMGFRVHSSPAVSGSIVYVGGPAGVYALNATTGGLIWNFSTSLEVMSSPAVSGGVVYVGSEDRNVYALNATTGAFIWSYDTTTSPGPGHVMSSPSVRGNVVYVGARNWIYALNATTGALVWRFYSPGCHHSSPAVSGGVVYVGNQEYHYLYALNATTSELIWKYTAGAQVHSSPAVADGKVYVGSFDHNVYAFNATTGAVVWSYTTGGRVVSSPAVAEGKVYIGSEDHNIYAFGIDETPPVTTSGLSGTLGLEGWYVSDVTVTLTATDDISGVAKTEYSFDNTTWTTYTTPFTITNEGTTIVYYNSTDKVGNAEATKTKTIKIDKTFPSANAGIDKTVAEDTSLTFDGLGSFDNIGIVSYTWAFTDVTPKTLTGMNPPYTFDTPDTYTVTLNVTDAAGHWDTDEVVITVLDVTPPVADAGLDQTVDEERPMTFDGSASSDNVGIVSYTWAFMDVTSQTLPDANPTYTFTTPGIYIVTLNVTDAAGNYATDTAIVTVLDVTEPVANVGLDQTVAEDTIVSFDASGSSDNVGIVSCEWVFGDGTTATGRTAIHSYTEPGTYTVTLTVKDAAGNSDTHSITITVLLDTDRDGTPDITDPDDDMDGTNDDEDAFPLDPTEWVDTDGDGIGNNADTDDDNDGVLDVNDSFPLNPTESVDTDRDGVGDNADTDDDNDRMPDGWEIENGLDPLDEADASLDPDGDGLTNLEEYQADTNPNVPDAEAFPLWVLVAAAALIGIAVAATFLWRRRK